MDLMITENGPILKDKSFPNGRLGRNELTEEKLFHEGPDGGIVHKALLGVAAKDGGERERSRTGQKLRVGDGFDGERAPFPDLLRDERADPDDGLDPHGRAHLGTTLFQRPNFTGELGTSKLTVEQCAEERFNNGG
jgi:hypothetical protein